MNDPVGMSVTVDLEEINGVWEVVEYPYEVEIPTDDDTEQYGEFFERLLSRYNCTEYTQVTGIRDRPGGITLDLPDALIRKDSCLCHVPLSRCRHV